jgi:hypothetical protein
MRGQWGNMDDGVPKQGEVISAPICRSIGRAAARYETAIPSASLEA